MERMFPLGFPLATGFYLSFYVLTLAIHVLFMNYVLAGTGYLALASLAEFNGGRVSSRSSTSRPESPTQTRSALTSRRERNFSSAVRTSDDASPSLAASPRGLTCSWMSQASTTSG